MKVKEIMEPVKQYWLLPESTLNEAVCTMRKTKWPGGGTVSGMLVLEHGLKLVGVISVKDIIRAAIPTYLDNNLRGVTWDGMFDEYVKKAGNLPVAKVMTRELVTIEAEDTLMHCAHLLISKKLQRLPVVDEVGNVLGIVHIRNLYEHITNIMCSLEP